MEYISVRRTATLSISNTSQPVLFTTIDGGNIPYNSTTGIFTLTAGKTYLLRGSGASTHSAGNNSVWGWYNESASTNIGAQVQLLPPTNGANEGTPGIAETVFTPTTNTNVSFRFLSGNNITYLGGQTYGAMPWATITQIGSSAVDLTTVASKVNDMINTVDYAYASPSSSAVTATSTTIPFSSLTAGNIALSSNLFTLKAGKTYELEAFMDFVGSTSSYADYGWVTASGTNLGGKFGISMPSPSTNGNSTTLAKAIYTPITDTQVKLSTGTTVSGINSLNTDYSYIKITQIGSTAVTGSTFKMSQVLSSAAMLSVNASAGSSIVSYNNASCFTNTYNNVKLTGSFFYWVYNGTGTSTTFTVSVDGTTRGTFSIPSPPTSGYFYNTANFDLVINGLSPGTHSLVITVYNATGGPAQVGTDAGLSKLNMTMTEAL